MTRDNAKNEYGTYKIKPSEKKSGGFYSGEMI